MDLQTATVHPITCLILIFTLLFVFYALNYHKISEYSKNVGISPAHSPKLKKFSVSAHKKIQEKVVLSDESSPLKNFGIESEHVRSSSQTKNMNFLDAIKTKRNCILEPERYNRSIQELEIHRKNLTKDNPSFCWTQKSVTIDKRKDLVETCNSKFPEKGPKKQDFYLYDLMQKIVEKQPLNDNDFLMPNLNPKVYAQNRQTRGCEISLEENLEPKEPERLQRNIVQIESPSILRDGKDFLEEPCLALKDFGISNISNYPTSQTNRLSKENNKILSEIFNRADAAECYRPSKKRKWDNLHHSEKSSAGLTQKTKALKIDASKLEDSTDERELINKQNSNANRFDLNLISKILKHKDNLDSLYNSKMSKARTNFIEEQSFLEIQNKAKAGISATTEVEKGQIKGLEDIEKIQREKAEENGLNDDKRKNIVRKLDDRFVSNRKKKVNVTIKEEFQLSSSSKVKLRFSSSYKTQGQRNFIEGKI